jgi:hypothetical protein
MDEQRKELAFRDNSHFPTPTKLDNNKISIINIYKLKLMESEAENHISYRGMPSAFNVQPTKSLKTRITCK